MHEAVRQIVKDIDDRLEQIRSEKTRLVAARSVLRGDSHETQRAPRSTKPRARSGARMDQFLSIVKDNPGLTVSEITKMMPRGPRNMLSYVHKLRTAAVSQDLVVAHGGRLFTPADAHVLTSETEPIRPPL